MSSRGQTCVPDTVAVDTSVAKVADFINLGAAVGQTFFAPESLSPSVTSWRPAAITDDHNGFHLHIVGTDSSEIMPAESPGFTAARGVARSAPAHSRQQGRT